MAVCVRRLEGVLHRLRQEVILTDDNWRAVVKVGTINARKAAEERVNDLRRQERDRKERARRRYVTWEG